MAQTHSILVGDARHRQPQVRKLGFGDLADALKRGTDDFAAIPSHAVFLCLIYPLAGLFLARLVFGYDILPLLYPLAAGFALLGPFAAIGLYELSRRRELGLETSWADAFDVFRSPSFGAIAALGVLLLVVFFVWIAVAQAIYVAAFGYAPAASIPEFFGRVLSTPEGWWLIVVGNGTGFLFALLVLTISVVSFPLLLDRDVGAADAVLTSVRVVARNPVIMAAWGLIVALALAVGMATFFLGLIVVMPVLGHATWHLYRKAVEPDPSPRPDYQPQPKPERYAADFPAVLFPWAGERKPPSSGPGNP
ncbi:MAG: DUF2189 domain-containing protein [Xanthobacteraceae bacterium]